MEISDIREQIEMYKLRAYDIEDHKIMIEEIKIGDTLACIGYEEKFGSLKECPNNDKALYMIDRLKKEIAYKTLTNKKVDNYLTLVNNNKHLQTVKYILIEKKSKTEVQKLLDISRRSVDNYLNTALETICTKLA